MKLLLQGLRKFTDMKELTPTIVDKLVKKIIIHSNEKKHSHNNVKVDIYFTAFDLLNLLTEQELLAMMDKFKAKQAITTKSA